MLNPINQFFFHFVAKNMSEEKILSLCKKKSYIHPIHLCDQKNLRFISFFSDVAYDDVG